MVGPAGKLEDLVGAELGGVCFVRNYVEFHFDGPILRSLAPPVIFIGARRWEFPHEGSRDAICQLIGRAVEGAADEPDHLVIRFADEASVEIPKASGGAGPEIAQFVPIRDGRLDVASMMIWENLVGTRGD
jgi:hypothetical protein